MKRNKRKKLYIIACIFMITGMVFIGGCSRQKEREQEEKTYVIGVVTKSRDSEYWMSVVSGMEKAAADLGMEVLILSPGTESDDSVQKRMIKDLIEKEVDAIAVSPIDSWNGASYIKPAAESGIPIYSYDTKIYDEESGVDIPYIGIDNEKAGRELAAYMADQMGNQGTVGIITGNQKQDSHKSRVMGFQSYMKEHTDIEIAFVESGYSNLQISEREITRLMEEYPGVSGIFASSAVTALGIVDYMKNQPVMIATIDAQEDAIEAVKEGKIAALAAQSGYNIGYEAIQYIMKDFNGEEQEPDDILDIEILTLENVNRET